MTQVGILHPGQMGATVGAAALEGGSQVAWASAGRSQATAARADRSGLADAGTLDRLAADSDVLISVCPPEAAADVAAAAAKAGFGGVFVDANAISPSTARALQHTIEESGARFVDGGIVGPPARSPGTTRLYLSGAGAGEVGALFLGSALEAIVVDGDVGAASALKATYAAYTKGHAALFLAVRALARAEGVEDALLAEWGRTQQDLEARSEGAAHATAPKAWRFVAELEEIADTFAAAGLPDGFHRAASEVYARLAGFKDARTPPTLDEVVEALNRGASASS